jgi:D-sedoheptulose 7-phosphate isomerase
MNQLMDKFQDFSASYVKRLIQLLNEMDLSQIDFLLDVCNQARLRGSTIYFAGNGGSASTASHFASDFLGANIKRKLTPAYQVVSLCDNNAIITAFGNDFGFEKIYTNQLESLYCEGDVLVVISASGNSPNVVEAVEWVNKKDGTTFGLLGFDGGKLLQVCTHSFVCHSEKGEYGPVEDIHLIVDHIINAYILQKQEG